MTEKLEEEQITSIYLSRSGRQMITKKARFAMMIRAVTSTRFVRLMLAPLLSLWIAGAGCMMGCQGMAASAAVPNSSPEKNSHDSGRKAS